MKTMQLSLKYLKDRSWIIDIVEKTIPKTFIKKDCFGFGDIIGIHPAYTGATLYQVTSYTNISARYNKIINLPQAYVWLRSGNKIIIHGWKKNKKIKRTDPPYKLIEKVITKEDLTNKI